MDIGKLSKRVTIQYRNAEIVGGFEEGPWEDYYKTWAKIKNIHGQELFIAKSLENKASSKITVRYCSKLKDIDPLKYRVIFKNEVYSIVSIDNINESNEYLEFLCERCNEKYE